MILSELIEGVRERMDDTLEPYLHSDRAMIIHFNRAQFEAARRALLIYDETTTAVCDIDIVTGTRVYDLHPRILAVTSATLDSTGMMLGRDPQIPQMDEHSPMWRSIPGTPTGFATFRNKLYLNHSPTEDDTLHIRVYRLPLDTEKLTSLSSVPVIPDEFQEDLEHWVLYRLFSKKDSDFYSPDDAKLELDRFEQKFGKAPSAKVANAMRDTPHGAAAHKRPFGGADGRANWYGHRY